eukprot:983848-Amphidinium_carterae.1
MGYSNDDRAILRMIDRTPFIGRRSDDNHGRASDDAPGGKCKRCWGANKCDLNARLSSALIGMAWGLPRIANRFLDQVSLAACADCDCCKSHQANKT